LFSVVVKLEDGSDDDLEMLKSEEIEDDSVIELKKANEETR
jgi:hypothetical protein